MRPVRTAGVVALLGVGVHLGTIPVLAPPADAQSGARLDLEAQTLFIDDEPAEVVIRVGGAPESARLRFIIYDDPARTREEVRAHHREPPTGGLRIANFECTLDGDCRDQATMTVGPAGIRTVTLDDDVIGESLRNNRGALPLVVQLLDEDGRSLDQLATSLVVLDDPRPTANGPYRVRVAFTARLVAPVALQADMRTVLDTDSLLDDTAPLAAHPDLPVTIEIRPETLDALARTDPSALQELLDIIDDRPLLRGPWVDMDEEAWRLAGESDQVISQYTIGSEAVERLTGRPPTELVRLDPDAGLETLTLLRSAGATTVLVDDAQLDPRASATPATRPLQIVDANGVAITALRYDEALHETLAGDDPELAAAQALAELAVLADDAETDLGVLLDINRIDESTLARLVDGIDARRTLEVDDVEALTRHELAQLDGEMLRGELVPTTPPDRRPLADDLEAITARLATVARMLESDIDLLGPFIAQLQAAVSADLEPGEATRYVRRIERMVREITTGIEIPTGDRITLTDRRTDLPLTLINRQSVALGVELLLTAEKVRFPEGARVALTLPPGETVVTVPVETLASGDARVTVRLVSPGGAIELGSGTIDIRSTAISGLGLVISLVALSVLAAWWIRTILRIRANRSAATVSAEPRSADQSPATAPTEGES